MRVGSSLSPWRHTYGGVPQGTKLGIKLFAIMINRLLGDWNSRLKYVDDTTVFKVITRNSSNLLKFAVRDIHNYCIEHSMRLNSQKCKEMVVNFMGNPNTIMRPLCIGNQIVERISSYKLLGVIINENLKWNCPVDHITAKVSKELYALRLLKRAGVQEQDMLKVFRSSVRLFLEYAVQVWQDIPDYLSDRIESTQKRAL